MSLPGTSFSQDDVIGDMTLMFISLFTVYSVLLRKIDLAFISLSLYPSIYNLKKVMYPIPTLCIDNQQNRLTSFVTIQLCRLNTSIVSMNFQINIVFSGAVS